MRLRLNTTLRAALIAAITAVGFTVSQVSAASPLEQAVQVFDSNITSTLTVENWTPGAMTVAVELDVEAFKQYMETTWMAGKGQVHTVFDCQGTWNSSQTTYNEGVLINGSSGSKYGTPYGEAYSPNGTSTTLNFGNVSESLKFNASTPWDSYESMSLVLTLDGASTMTASWVILDKTGSYTTYSGSKTGVKWSSSTAFTPNGTLTNIDTDMVTYVAVFDKTKTSTDVDIAKAVLERGYESAEYLWNGAGDSDNWNTESQNWFNTGTGQVATYVSAPTSDAIFGTGNVAKEVTIASVIQARTVNVQDNYTFNLSNGGGLTASSLSIATGATLTTSGNGTIIVSGVSGTGNLVKGDAGTMTMSGSANYTGNITVNGGTLKAGSADAFGNMSGDRVIKIATGGTLDVNGQEGNAADAFAVEFAGGTLTNTGNNVSYGSRQFVTSAKITANSTIDSSKHFGFTAGGYRAITVAFENGAILEKKGTGEFYVTNATITGNGSFKVTQGNLRFQDTVTSAANFIMNGGTVSSGQKAGSLKLSANISVTTDADSTFSVPVNTNGHTITFTGAANLTASGVISGSGAITKTGEGTLTLSGANTYTGNTTVSAGTVVASNASALGTTGTVTVAAGAELKVNAALGLAGRLQSSGNITVTENGNLTLAASSMISNVVSNSGAVNLSGVTLSQDGGFTETGGGTAYFDLAGAVTTAEANHYEGTAGKYVQVVDNGELGTSTGTGLVWKDKSYDLQENGTIIVEDGTPDYGTFYVMTQVSSSQLIDSDNYEKLNTIVVGGWAELNMDEAISGKTIEVLDGGFVTGTQVTPESIAMDAGAVTVFNNDVTTENGVTFSAQVAVSMTNTNQEGGPVQYSTGAEAIAVTADTMTVGPGEAETEISNSLVVKEIVNNNENGLLLQGNVADVVTLNAAAGDITMVGQTNNTLSVVDLTIAAGKSVEMLNEGLEEGTITVTGVLTGGDATLLSNLTLKGGSTLDVNGGDTHALTLGSMLTIDLTEGGLVNLDQTTIDALNDMQGGDKLDLIVALNTEWDPLTYGSKYDGVSYDQLFSAAGLQGNYTVYAQGDAFGLMKSTSPIPEPTTGTLSLLALAALAARRRRK